MHTLLAVDEDTDSSPIALERIPGLNRLIDFFPPRPDVGGRSTDAEPKPASIPRDANRARVGKIARLPDTVREELNLRLRDGEPARVILPWLNELPEARGIFERLFGGHGVNEQNLSTWRRGGYVTWLKQARQLEWMRECAQRAVELVAAAGDKLTEAASVLAIAKLLERLMADEEMESRELHRIIASVVKLRRVEISEQRVGLGKKRDEQSQQRQKLAERKFEHQVRVYEDKRAMREGGRAASTVEKLAGEFTPKRVREMHRALGLSEREVDQFYQANLEKAEKSRLLKANQALPCDEQTGHSTTEVEPTAGIPEIHVLPTFGESDKVSASANDGGGDAFSVRADERTFAGC